MKLEELLLERASQVLKRWTDLIFDSYPADARRFLRKQEDPFANPVGSAFSREIETFYREFIGPANPEKLSAALETVIRIRSVQEFSASGAVRFLFLLKKIIREETSKEVRGNRISQDELLALESRLDDAALAGFDLYMKCKEKVYEIRAGEARSQVSGLLRRAGLISEVPAWDSEGKKSTLG
ncbi:MAG: RsbRD N-terminal domain-containing protein [Deltaproteobacteria bacterium]|nr:RsbRD N-terminal domain-containing protein [Deltaproteobacteria bacterium]